MRRWAWVLLGLLLLENLVGIFATLYISLPRVNAILSIYRSYPILGLHVSIAFLMVAIAAYLVVFAHRNGYRRIRTWAAWEVVFLAVAIQEGFAFAATLDDVFSFGMELAFLLAVLAVVRLLTLLGRSVEWPPTDGRPVAL
jgi:hypothetical protein